MAGCLIRHDINISVAEMDGRLFRNGHRLVKPLEANRHLMTADAHANDDAALRVTCQEWNSGSAGGSAAVGVWWGWARTMEPNAHFFFGNVRVVVCLRKQATGNFAQHFG